MRHIIGTLHCSSAHLLSEHEVRKWCDIFLECTLPYERPCDLHIEIAVDSEGTRERAWLDKHTSYTRLDGNELPRMILDETHPFLNVERSAQTHVWFSMGNRAYITAHLALIGLALPQEHDRDIIAEQILAHAEVKDGDMSWFDTDLADGFYQRNAMRMLAQA